MDRPVVVGISDMKVTLNPGSLITYALGSCVGICLHDPLHNIAGLSHVLLPDSKMCPSDGNIAKFADTAVEELVRRMEQVGAKRFRLTAKIAGGARLFGNGSGIQVGERNVASVKAELARLRIRLVAEDTGADYGRTVEFLTDGTMYIKTALKGTKSL